jgi:hypothetical protein
MWAFSIVSELSIAGLCFIAVVNAFEQKKIFLVYKFSCLLGKQSRLFTASGKPLSKSLS